MKRFVLRSSERGLVVRVFSILCSAWLAIHAAHAHTLPISTLTLVSDEGYLHLDLTLNPFELTFFSELDANRNGTLDLREWTGQGEKIAWRILDNLKLRVNDRLVVPDIAGLSQTYESHHITVRAHFAVDAQRARVSLESHLADLTSGSHITQVTFGAGEHLQAARLDMQSKKVTFEPFEPTAALGSTVSAARNDLQTFTAFKVNETAVMALLALLFLAGMPPAIFFVLSTRFRTNQDELPRTAFH